MIVRVRVRPGASRNAVGGRWERDDGPSLTVAVAAPAQDGRANEAVRQALAEAFGVRPRQVTQTGGWKARDKTFELDGDETTLRVRLDVLLKV